MIDREVAVHEEKADVVRSIFDAYLAGASLGKIVDLLFKRGVASPTGKAKWTRAAIDKLLATKSISPWLVLRYTWTLSLRRLGVATWIMRKPDILERQSDTNPLHLWPDETIQNPFLLLYC